MKTYDEDGRLVVEAECPHVGDGSTEITTDSVTGDSVLVFLLGCQDCIDKAVPEIRKSINADEAKS